MAKQSMSGGSGTQPIKLDVLIIGGGVQGLWLLNDLQQHGYSVLLLERRELGGEQTCHSHVYIHQGHLYRELDLAEPLKVVRALWDQWFNVHYPPQYGVRPSHFGFRDLAEAQRIKSLWEQPRLQLSYKSVPLPAALNGGVTQVVFESPETCLDAQWLVEELRRGPGDFISSIHQIERISINGNQVEEVQVIMPGRERLTFQPQALILAAGAGNQGLLDLASGGKRQLLGLVSDAQQIRKAHMLIVKGKKGDLDQLTGVFELNTRLFIVSRDLGNETVWLISDDRSPSLWFIEDWMAYDARSWLPRVWVSLQQLAPRYFKQPNRLEWGIYEAPKAEGRAGGVIPGEERIEQFGLKNLWTVWPTKLTLAPKVSDQVRQQIQKLIRSPNPWASIPPVWSQFRVPATVAPERWKNTPLMSWDEFRRCYYLP